MQAIKEILKLYTTGVTIISCRSGEKFSGFTANSFTSVSLDPPLILFCLNEKSSNVQNLDSHPYFNVNILKNTQKDISNKFASRIENKFEGVNYSLSKNSKCPIINNSMAWIECKVKSKIKQGDHFIFIGEILDQAIISEGSPLLYHSRNYHNIGEIL